MLNFCSDSSTLQKIGDLKKIGVKLRSQYIELVTAYIADWSEDKPNDYPSQADASLFKAINAFKAAVTKIQELHEQKPAAEIGHELKSAFEELSIALHTVRCAVKKFKLKATDPNQSAVNEEVNNIIKNWFKALQIRNTLLGLFEKRFGDDEGTTSGEATTNSPTDGEGTTDGQGTTDGWDTTTSYWFN